MNVSVAVYAVSPNSSLGEQREDGSFLADHAADEGVDGDEERELGGVLAQPEPHAARRDRGRSAHQATSRGMPVVLLQSSGPPMSTARS